MLHRFGHGLLVIIVACLCLMPARAEADIITTLVETDPSGILRFSGDFGADNDVALINFSLADTAVVSVEITHLAASAGFPFPGFDPFLTLFGPGTEFRGAFGYLGDTEEGFPEEQTLSDGVTLSGGDYVLALTQFNNYYSFDGGFDYDDAVLGRFTYEQFVVRADAPDPGCREFVSWDAGCRSPNFAGTLSVQPGDALIVQPVPEPGSLALLIAGGLP